MAAVPRGGRAAHAQLGLERHGPGRLERLPRDDVERAARRLLFAFLLRMPNAHAVASRRQVGDHHAAVRALQRLLDGGRAWVKLSAAYEISKSGPPRYDDVGAIARTLAASHPERCLWGSNWPHGGRPDAPSNAALLDLLLDWVDDDATRRRILVDNPAALYGFAPPRTDIGTPAAAQ